MDSATIPIPEKNPAPLPRWMKSGLIARPTIGCRAVTNGDGHSFAAPIARSGGSALSGAPTPDLAIGAAKDARRSVRLRSEVRHQRDEHPHPHLQRRVGEVKAVTVQRRVAVAVVRLDADEEEAAGDFF